MAKMQLKIHPFDCLLCATTKNIFKCFYVVFYKPVVVLLIQKSYCFLIACIDHTTSVVVHVNCNSTSLVYNVYHVRNRGVETHLEIGYPTEDIFVVNIRNSREPLKNSV
jgi:hypothetical protein